MVAVHCVDSLDVLQVCKVLGVTEELLNRLTLTPNTEHVDSFKLHQRALHVFQGKQRQRV